MGFLSSAYSWLQNQVNSAFGSTPPANMSLNSNHNSLGTPIKIDLSDSGPMEIFNPFIDPFRAYKEVTEADKVASDTEVGGSGNNPSSYPYSSSSSGISSPKLAEFDFINAELAKHYGMSKSTAYQEALANTAYQRAVKDMTAAGLNPGVIFGNGRATTANSAIYGHEAISGGSGGSYRRGSGSKNDNLFSSSEYGAIATVGGIIGLIATGGKSGGYTTGSQIAQGAMNLMNALHNSK